MNSVPEGYKLAAVTINNRRIIAASPNGGAFLLGHVLPSDPWAEIEEDLERCDIKNNLWDLNVKDNPEAVALLGTLIDKLSISLKIRRARDLVRVALDNLVDFKELNFSHPYLSEAIQAVNNLDATISRLTDKQILDTINGG